MRKRKQSIILKGYPIPYARQEHVIWVNATPHLSARAASLHSSALGIYSYRECADSLYEFLEPLLSTQHANWNAEWHQAAITGPEAVQRKLSSFILDHSTGRSMTYMLDKLLEDKTDVDGIDPMFQGSEQTIWSKLFQWVEDLPDDPLGRYERKMFNKYLGEASSRTGEQYLKQVQQYLPQREEFTSIPMPDMACYDRALTAHYNKLGLKEITADGVYPADVLVGFLDRARKTTFGGYPFLANMADFVSADEADPTTYADWYNYCAIGYLYLQPSDKVKFYSDYIALERIQAGGAEDITLKDDELQFSKKVNKQRFVQAQSAVLSHAHKFLVDGTTEHLRRMRPHFVADKFSEDFVTAEMKSTVAGAVSKRHISPDATALVNIVGTDFTNYDAHQDVTQSNDTCYNVWRMLFPAFMTEFIIDPYIKLAYRQSRILVPKYGAVHTTGVKSGMVDTNQTDTLNCSLCDEYELLRYFQDHPEGGDLLLPKNELIQMCDNSNCANGDDRFKLSPCSAADLENYDWELGYIAQQSKQEILYSGSPLADLSVTYLKTIICLRDQGLVRTDAISKLILARVSPEDVKVEPTPNSIVVDCIMSASRSVESPYLYVLVDFMYVYMPQFRSLVDGDLTPDQLIAGMVKEQMDTLRRIKGKKWMRRKGVDYDYVIERMNTKYGYGDEGYRAQNEALVSERPASGLTALPAYQAIMSLAQSRVASHEIGAIFLR